MCWVCERATICRICGLLYIALRSFGFACPLCGPEPIDIVELY